MTTMHTPSRRETDARAPPRRLVQHALPGLRRRHRSPAQQAACCRAFRDINLEPDALASHGASLEDVRRRLHATDEAGRLLVGADVAIAIWRLTPGEHWLARLTGNPVTRPLTRFVYDRFADLLYAWNRRKGHW
jgi:predicted DCC family thiol-disulfide oxidoreductase YuxK